MPGAQVATFINQTGNNLIFYNLSWYFMDHYQWCPPHSSEGVIGHNGWRWAWAEAYVWWVEFGGLTSQPALLFAFGALLFQEGELGYPCIFSY